MMKTCDAKFYNICLQYIKKLNVLKCLYNDNPTSLSENRIHVNYRSHFYRSYSSDIKQKELSPTLSFKHFLEGNSSQEFTIEKSDNVPYLADNDVNCGIGQKVYIETYGCQMNVNDTEIVLSILKDKGFERATDISHSDVILLMTCAIREGAEQKIWNRLRSFRSLKRDKQRAFPLRIALLGCMAERLKDKILDKEKLVDVVCGPDAYRDLPRLLSISQNGQKGVNVLLSQDETYADVVPVRINNNSPSAFVSIMRGCDNMCTYCIVPFTRGRERSRPISSILEEIQALSDQGIKEVTLLGQNVNSYRDMSETTVYPSHSSGMPTMSKGFTTVYKSKLGGRRFADLLDAVSLIDPEMRIRFTSPHPKDFPDEVLQVIRSRSNICKQLHMPAQSGSSAMLKAMGRGYTREAYIELIEHVRQLLPDVSLSSDFIAGFCGETEEDHQQSLSLLEHSKYSVVYAYPYSMREKTRAHHRLTDDVPQEIKARRHLELWSTYRRIAEQLFKSQIGNYQLVLVEGRSKRSPDFLAGRNDGNIKVIFPDRKIAKYPDATETMTINKGDYVIVKITDANSQVIKGQPVSLSKLQDFSAFMSNRQLVETNYNCLQSEIINTSVKSAAITK